MSWINQINQLSSSITNNNLIHWKMMWIWGQHHLELVWLMDQIQFHSIWMNNKIPNFCVSNCWRMWQSWSLAACDQHDKVFHRFRNSFLTVRRRPISWTKQSNKIPSLNPIHSKYPYINEQRINSNQIQGNYRIN